MKLIKNKRIIKFPRSRYSVKNILKKATDISKIEKWNEVIIITRTDDAVGIFCSKARLTEKLGMLDYAKQFLYDEV